MTERHGCLRAYLLYLVLCIVYFIFTAKAITLLLPNLQSDYALGFVITSTAVLSILTVLLINNRDFLHRMTDRIASTAKEGMSRRKTIWILTGVIITVICLGLFGSVAFIFNVLSRSYKETANWVRSLAWSPDGSFLAAGSSDSCITIWEARSGNQNNVLHGQEGSVRSLEWSADGRMLAAGEDARGDITVWDPRSGNWFFRFTSRGGSLGYLAWSPDGEKIAISNEENGINIWQVYGTRPKEILSGHSGLITSVAWSPNGSLIATSSADETLGIWNVSSGELIHKLSSSSGRVNDVDWSPDNNAIVSGADDGSVIIWSSETGDQIRKLTDTGSIVSIYGVAWSPSGQNIASVGLNNQVIIWDVSSGKPIKSLMKDNNSFLTVEWSPDGQYLAAGSEANEIFVWETKTWQEVWRMPSACASLSGEP